jgi:hypothetical protein
MSATGIRLDSSGQIIEGVWLITGYAAQGVVVEGVGAVLGAIRTLD